ncbi:peptidase [Streptomyces nitrosporeus]|uniref:peptidase n=1 Tax=Streptomyces nitrosporeus TaxID=28894 RepID=UPI003316FFF3
MKIRRTLATAVALAVTAPVVLLSATAPAFAGTEPTARTQAEPSLEELKNAAAAAQEAYDKAVAAQVAAMDVLEATHSEAWPPAVAADAARQAAEKAATAKTDADQAVVDARTALDALPVDADTEERTAAEAALADAEAAAVTAATAKEQADAEAFRTDKEADDARVAASRAYGDAKAAVEKALTAKKAADAALAEAEAEAEEEEEGGTPGGEECVPVPELTSVVTGLPSAVVAGTTTAFSLRVTNGTDEAMNRVLAFADVQASDKSGLKEIDELLRLQWSTAASPKWRDVEHAEYIDTIGPLKAGAHADIKLRLTVDASAPAGEGIAFVAGDYFNKDGSCGQAPDLVGYEFVIAAANSDPGKADDAKPGKTKPNHGAQGTTSKTPVNTTGGTLAATGTSPANTRLALASGTALTLGAAAMLLARRRRTDSGA